jgi:hypothetical protein
MTDETYAVRKSNRQATQQRAAGRPVVHGTVSYLGHRDNAQTRKRDVAHLAAIERTARRRAV